MTDPSRALDVVVLGGGGHVGLPLSLVLAKAGLRVGIYDTNQATLDRIAAGEMPFLENGADELLREVLATGRLEFGSDGSMIERTETLVVVIGTPGRRVPRPIDDGLREGGQPDRPAPPGRRARRPAQHGLPGHDRLRRASTSQEAGCNVDVAFCPERIAEGHALEELHSLPQIIGADDDRAAERATALFARIASKTIRTSTKEAELAKLFTNTWRYMKFAVANQFFMIADQAGVDYDNVLRADPRGLPARQGPAGPRLRRRAVPVQGHDAAVGLHDRPLPDGPGRDAGQRGPAGLHRRRRSSVATAACRARPSASWAWPSRPSRTTPARRSATSCASSWPGPGRASCARTRTSRTTG